MTNRNFNYKELEKVLKDHDSNKVNDLTIHIESLRTAKNKKGDFACKWFVFLTVEKVVKLFTKATSQGLSIDGRHIVIENRAGKIQLSYDYIAYKNRLLTVYPEAKIDFGVVYKDDDFSIAKKDGKIFYSHKINSPFNNDDDQIIGVYCVIKINTGEFFITLDCNEIKQLRKKATTDCIWASWYKDMCIKSAIKKIVSKHFDDIYRDINEDDNETINLENPIDIEIELKQQVEKIEELEELTKFYHDKLPNIENKNSFIKILSIRKEFIITRDNNIVTSYNKLAEFKDIDEAEKLISNFSKMTYQDKLKEFENLKSK